MLHPPKVEYNAGLAPIIGLVIDGTGVFVDGMAILSTFPITAPVTVPIAAELEFSMSTIETLYYIGRLEQGYPEDALLAAAQEQSDIGSILPGVGIISSAYGIYLDLQEIHQGITITPY